jgi:predicted amidohydrolase
MRVSLVQLDVSLDRPLAARVDHAAGLVRGCEGSDLVLLPELWAHGAWAYDEWEAASEPLDGPTVESMRSAARDAAVLLHAGSIAERADGALYNTSVLIDASGEIVATYRKIHRFGFGEGEGMLMSAGDDIVTWAGGGAVLGLATCYDLRFPELFRLLVDEGAEMFAVASSWPQRRLAHWRLLAQARAVDNLAYVLACNSRGEHSGVRLAGHTMVVDPWGDIVAEAGDEETVVSVELDPSLVGKTRATFPALRDRRLPLRRD